MNLELARVNMIEHQLRPWEVADEGTLDALSSVAREAFVPPAWRSFAYGDFEIPLGHGAVMLTPRVEARALQALRPQKRDNVLEIGAGSGYFAALLAARADRVLGIEIAPELAELARANLQSQGIRNVAVACGDGARGWADGAPFDVIMVSGSVPVVPDEMKAQMSIGGRLFAVVGEAPAMTATLLVREAEDAWRTTGLFETQTRRLRNAPCAHARRLL
ncbi:MAG: protein-L-isoaspartate O-methyltransferase family protein [Ignavibacteria bacterium]